MFHYGRGINFLPEVDAAIHALFRAMAIEGGLWWAISGLLAFA